MNTSAGSAQSADIIDLRMCNKKYCRKAVFFYIFTGSKYLISSFATSIMISAAHIS